MDERSRQHYIRPLEVRIPSLTWPSLGHVFDQPLPPARNPASRCSNKLTAIHCPAEPACLPSRKAEYLYISILRRPCSPPATAGYVLRTCSEAKSLSTDNSCLLHETAIGRNPPRRGSFSSPYQLGTTRGNRTDGMSAAADRTTPCRSEWRRRRYISLAGGAMMRKRSPSSILQ